jgi:hypothetical protein
LLGMQRMGTRKNRLEETKRPPGLGGLSELLG